MPRKIKKEYNAYMRKYLPAYRKGERELLKEYKKLKGIPDKRRKKKQ